jgi:hypothetical protein
MNELAVFRFRARWAVIVASALALAMALVSPAEQARADQIPNPSRLSAVWWQWILSTPVAVNPAFDDTGENALINQPYADQGLIFLCGSFTSSDAHRTITVPAGTAFFFPVVNTENDNVFYDRPVSVPRLRADAAAIIDGDYDIHAELDGGPLSQARLASPVFPYFLPDEDNIYQFFGLEITGPIAPAVSDGYWSYIPPLPPGDYVLTFGATTPSSTPAQPPFTFNITYTIHVE